MCECRRNEQVKRNAARFPEAQNSVFYLKRATGTSKFYSLEIAVKRRSRARILVAAPGSAVARHRLGGGGLARCGAEPTLRD